MLGGLFRGGTFEARYRVYPMAFLDKPGAEEGDKVILPASALDRLASLHVEYPMLFHVEAPGAGRKTHCGVLEFVADEGNVYLPHWMMNNLLLQVGDVAIFRNVSLPKGTYCKLQPVTSDFLDISNPKAVLEKSLRTYTCLTTGDCFVVNYNDKKYEIEVKETRPGPAISVVETDCQVDFEAPKDYKEPEPAARGPPGPAPGPGGPPEEDDDGPRGPDPNTFMAFSGAAVRLDGKQVTGTSVPVPVNLNRGLTRVPEPEANGKASTSGARGPKAGKMVSLGNRLLDKLSREGAAEGARPPEVNAKSTGGQQSGGGGGGGEEGGDDPGGKDGKFAAFSGKSYSLK
ncbi:unnamed protein product [Ostreobium quekettii]|uniref:Uncharacterized protein n=1 Tax=Ostreobium quekettii TaxID=121088 RepID=A0A8S1JEM7_9CHLO|nr:unnamed protein product [Ostreobium quekettii]|eukprot:evm.model.scf_1238.2 EVM.evm.TU.scf_1238.2   scf_1238:19926-24915(+)